MEKAVAFLQDQLVCIRGSKISAGWVDTVRVPYEGQLVPIKNLAFAYQNKAGIVVKPNDLSTISAIEKALKDAGVAAYIFSKEAILVSLPPLGISQKAEVARQIKKLGEDAKISIRNVRRVAKKSDDSDEVQKSTDLFVNQVDEIVTRKIASL